MKKYFKILALLVMLPAFGFGQIVKTAAVTYTKGSNPYTVNLAGSSEIRIDTATSVMYWWKRDALTWVRVPYGVDVITGSIPPAYIPRDNQSVFAINAIDSIYYYNGADWKHVNAGGGGSDGNGIYSGSGTTGAPFTTATIDSIMRFLGDEATDRFIAAVAGGTDVASVSVFDTLAQIQYDDASGTNVVEANNEGIALTTNTADRVTITGKDARYAADYSGTFSAHSLVDKAYVDGAFLSGADWTTGFSSATQNTSSWTATNAASDVNGAIIPKGTGALLAEVPDGTATGGNARGQYAVDWQMLRTNATDVASGNYSTIPGGRRCTASGTYSFASGFRGTASGDGSVAFGGSGAFSVGATASGTNSFAHGSGATASGTNSFSFGAGSSATASGVVSFNSTADKQSQFSANGLNHLTLSELTLGTGTQELFLDGNGGTLRATIGSNKLWVAEVRVCARVSVVGNGTGLTSGDVYAATYKVVIQNLGGTTALVGTVQADMAAQSAASMAGSAFTIAADNTNDALTVTYTPNGNEGTTTQTSVYAAIWYNEF